MRVVGELPEPGRPDRWLPSMAKIIYQMALVGMSRNEMAHALGIRHETFLVWDCQSIASACLRNGGVSRYDYDASLHNLSIYDLIMRGRHDRWLLSVGSTFLPEVKLSRSVKASLTWLFNPPQHYLLDEWWEDAYVITLRRPASLNQARWLDCPAESMLTYRGHDGLDEVLDCLNDWRIPKQARVGLLLELGESVHEILRRGRFWGDKSC